MPSALTADNLGHSFGDRVLFHEVNLSLAEGQVTSVMGASGSGKSTLLYALAGLRRPTVGSVYWSDSNNVWDLGEPKLTLLRRRHCGFVFQFPAFVDDLTVTENVALPMVISGASRKESAVRAIKVLDELGLVSSADRYPNTLSGGELQRMSIARALAGEPDIIFADEPTGALDGKNSENVVESLVSAARLFGVAVLIVTHDPNVAHSTDRTMVFDGASLMPLRG